MFKYLALTIAIELPIYFLFNRSRIFYTILILILANFLTWPLLNILYHSTTIPLAILESGVTVTEAAILYFYLDQPILKALLISSVQNIISTLIGSLL